MDKNKIAQLLEKYVDGTCTSEERSLVESWYNHKTKLISKSSEPIEVVKEEVWDRINPSKDHKQRFRLPTKVAAAAVVLVLSLLSSLILLYKNEKFGSTNNMDAIHPGEFVAFFTAASGQSIVLPRTESGISFIQSPVGSSTTDLFISNGDFSSFYTQDYYNYIFIEDMNTIRTPLGANYQIVLEDGTKVWLNAGSELSFPSSFKNKSNRQVHLSGEAYFEVAKDVNKTFTVKYNNQEVRVLGTKFNIAAYPEFNRSEVTLLEGAVELVNYDTNNKESHRILLKPKEQVVIGKDVSVRKVLDTEKTIAWKEGVFLFNDDKLSDILEELSRWYKVDIDYSSVPERRFNGQISKKSSLAEVLEMFEITGDISFKISNNKLSVDTNRLTSK